MSVIWWQGIWSSTERPHYLVALEALCAEQKCADGIWNLSAVFANHLDAIAPDGAMSTNAQQIQSEIALEQQTGV